MTAMKSSLTVALVAAAVAAAGAGGVKRAGAARHPGRVPAASPLAAWLSPLPFCPLQATEQDPANLSDEEEDRLREAQDPSQRIEVYLQIAQTRLSRFEELRSRPPDARPDAPQDVGVALDRLLGEYIAVDDELKNWIDYQYQRDGDMRRGLRLLLSQGPQQLVKLRSIEQSPDAHFDAYRESLRDAIDDLSDTLDGATTAFSSQEKKFGELKRELQQARRDAKAQAKQEKKLEKEERKLEKKERKAHKQEAEPDDSSDRP